MEGQLTTAYKELLAGNQQTTAGQAVGLQEQLQQAIQGLPHLAGQLAIVLDLSASMASSGERLYYPAALALVMVQQLRDLVREVVLVQVGGSDPALQHFSPAPQGASDLATGLLDALRSQPDLVIIMSDGYENQRQGDVAQVVAGLKQLEINVPIYQVVPLFASSENLEQRVFGTGIPVLPLTHEQDIRDLLTYALLASAEESLTLQEMEQLQQIWYGEVQV
jgi:hypothetical protein